MPITRSARRTKRRRELREQRAALSRSAAEAVNAATRAAFQNPSPKVSYTSLYAPLKGWSHQVDQCRCLSNACWDCQISSGFNGRQFCCECGGLRDRLAYLDRPWCEVCQSTLLTKEFDSQVNCAVLPQGSPPGYKVSDNVPSGYRGVFEKPDPCP